MKATKELRNMLNERGVKWSDVFAAMNRSKFTHFEPKDQMQVDVWERDGEFIIQVTAEMDLIPEKVIAATLGECENATPTNPHATCVVLEGENPPEEVLYHGPNEVTHYLPEHTCRITVQDNLAETDGMGEVWLECDACHWQMLLEPSTPRFNFCPNCGRKVMVK